MNALTAISRAGPGPAGAVKAVSVISTGTVRIRPEHPTAAANRCTGNC